MKPAMKASFLGSAMACAALLLVSASPSLALKASAAPADGPVQLKTYTFSSTMTMTAAGDTPPSSAPAFVQRSSGAPPNSTNSTSPAGLSSPQATTTSFYGYQYTPQAPFYDTGDSSGSLMTQATYGTNSAGQNTLAFGYIFSPSVQATVNGVVATAQCKSFRNGRTTGYQYDDRGKPSDYNFHSSITEIDGATQYQLGCVYQWPAVGGGTATLIWYFNYVITLV